MKRAFNSKNKRESGSISIAIIAMIIIVFCTVVIAAGEREIWTANEDGLKQSDFLPESDVYIYGSGFSNEFLSYAVLRITRPDGFVNEGYPEINDLGDFLYIYDLNGIEGTYNIFASDGFESVEVNFTDSSNAKVLTYDVAGGRKYLYSQGETVYVIAENLWSSYNYKFTYYNPSGVVVRTYCSGGSTSLSDTYPVPSDAETESYRIIVSEHNSSDTDCSETPVNSFKTGVRFNVYDSDAIILQPIDDTYVKWNGENGSHHNLTHDKDEIHTKKYTSLYLDSRRSYFKFDLTQIPDDAEIEKVIFHLSRFRGDSNNFEVSVHKVFDNSWAEETLTWDDQPCGHNFDDLSCNIIASLDDVPVENLNGGYIWDVLSSIDTGALSSNLISYILKLTNEVNGRHEDFCDKESSFGESFCVGNLSPYLEIVLSGPTCEDHQNSTSCGEDPECDWCPECDGLPGAVNQWHTDMCVPAGTGCGYTCDISYCQADCEVDSDCYCPSDRCVGNDYYDYPDYGACSGCECDTGTGSGEPCEPEISYDDPRCVECNFYDDEPSCVLAQCKWCSQCSGDEINQWGAGACVSPETDCGYQCDIDICGAECETSEDCESYCDGDIAYTSGACDNCECFWIPEDCSQYSGWVDTGETRWVELDECNEKEQKEQEYHDYTCITPDVICDYIVDGNQWVDTGETRPKEGLVEICDDGVDNDCDGDIDCEDSDCLGEVGPGGNVCCESNDDCDGLPEIATCFWDPDLIDPTFDYHPEVPPECGQALECVPKSYGTITHTCADSDGTDGVPYVGGLLRTCSAECDQSNDCNPYLEADVCYYNGECASCACDYLSEPCPEPGTVIDGICYYGERDCTENGCSIDSEEMGCNDYCDPVLGPVDAQGPVSFDTFVWPNPTDGIINITASSTDNCNIIIECEYFVDECGEDGTGTDMIPVDGVFDEITEDIYSYDQDLRTILDDGRHDIFTKCKDALGTWGECDSYAFDVDKFPPVTVNQNVTAQMACGDDPIVEALICDEPPESIIVDAEYFLDVFTLPNGYGYPMLPMDGLFDEYCEYVNASVDIGPLTEGTHYIKVHGKDFAGHWGKLTPLEPIWFIKDTTPPTTTKEVGDPKFPCSLTSDGENELEACWFIKPGTPITLSAQDFNPGDDEFSGEEIIYYRTRYKYDYEDPWGNWSGWSEYNAPIIFNDDSIHEIEYYSIDWCENEEDHHFEIDIVDSKPPVTNKSVGDPKVECNPGGCHYYIRQDTEITLECNDQEPHPIDTNTLYWRYRINDGEWQEFSAPEPSVTFTYPQDSIHTLEYWCADALNNTEIPQLEVDIVDSQPPEINKTLIGMQIEGDGFTWIRQDSEVQLTCTDSDPHPVGGEEIYYRYFVDGNLSVDWTKYTGPFTFPEDSEHLLEYYCKDALNNTGQTETEVDKVDTQGPEVFKDLSGPQIHEENFTWITNETEIYFSCSDPGICAIDNSTIYYKYRVDGGDWIGPLVWEGPFRFGEDSVHELEYWCVDELENEGDHKTETDKVDSTPPSTRKAVGDPKHDCETGEGCEYYISQNTNITLTCVDGGDICAVDDVTLHYKYQINNGSWTEFEVNGPEVTFTFPEDSIHTLKYWCVDKLGNTEKKHTEVDIVDTQEPELTKEIIGKQIQGDGFTWIRQDTKIWLTCEDTSPHPVDHVKIFYRYYLDGMLQTGWIEHNQSQPIMFGEDSEHILEYYCVDELGNVDGIFNETDKVDSTGPKVNKTIGTPNFPCAPGEDCSYYITQQTPITLTCDDPGVCAINNNIIYYRFRVDGGNWTEPIQYSSPFTFTEDSVHELEYWCVDGLENEGDHETQVDKVDSVAPTTSKTVGDPKVECGVQEDCDYYITQDTEITLACVDGGDICAVDDVTLHYKYQINNGSWTEFEVDGPEVTFTFPEDSIHTLKYWCKDALNNTERYHNEVDIVDTQKPEINKSVGTPKVKCDEYEILDEVEGCDYYLKQDTPISLFCTDLGPHPVDDVVIEYRYRYKDYPGDAWSGWVGWNIYNESFTFPEDSIHELEYKCTDALMNSVTESELDVVDTEHPETNKTISGPKYWSEERQAWFINENTNFTLEGVDPDPHPVDFVTTKYRYRYSCDGEVWTGFTEWEVYSGLFSFEDEGYYEVQYYSKDFLNNEETVKTELDILDNTEPHVVIFKPVDGWYSDGEDIAVVAQVYDKNYTCGEVSGIDEEDPILCKAFLVDYLPEFQIVELEGHLLYNPEAGECQGHVTIPDPSGLPDGIVYLVIEASDNVGNIQNTTDVIWEAYENNESDFLKIIYTIWNLPKIGIDNNPPVVEIIEPEEGDTVGGEGVYVRANVNDGGDGEVTSTITTGTPCYVSVGGVQIGVVPYSAKTDSCEGTLPLSYGIPSGTQDLMVEIFDNAGNLGSDTVEVNIDIDAPIIGPIEIDFDLDIEDPENNMFVSGVIGINVTVIDSSLPENLDELVELSTNSGQHWMPPDSCMDDTCFFTWDTTTEEEGLAFGIIARMTDGAGNVGYSDMVMVIVDNEGGEISAVLAPYPEQVVTGTFTLEGLASDQVSGIDKVEFYINDEKLTGATDYEPTGNWNTEWDSTAVPDGAHTAKIRAYDNAGHYRDSQGVEFVVDNEVPICPTVFYHNPMDQLYDRDGVVTWLWEPGTDLGSGVDHYILTVTYSNGESEFTTPYNVPASGDGMVAKTLSDIVDGEYVAALTVFDESGKMSECELSDTVIVDTVPPEDIVLSVTEVEKIGSYYDTDGSYSIVWSGGDDSNFDRFDLLVDGIVNANVSSPFAVIESDGEHTYKVLAYDLAGWVTESEETAVIVDTQPPELTVNTVVSGLGIFLVYYSVVDPEPSSGIERVEIETTNGLAGCLLGMCIGTGENASLTAYDMAGNSDTEQVSSEQVDRTAPRIVLSGPSGTIESSSVTLMANTDEPAVCWYGLEDDITSMSQLDENGSLEHSVLLEGLDDSMYIYHVLCEDFSGNRMEASKTIVFVIDTTGDYEMVIPDDDYWAVGWHAFFLPKIILNEMNLSCEENVTYALGDVLVSLNLTGTPTWDKIWYCGSDCSGPMDWVFADNDPETTDLLSEFNDYYNRPYYIYINTPSRLELSGQECNGD